MSASDAADGKARGTGAVYWLARLWQLAPDAAKSSAAMESAECGARSAE